MVVTVKNEMDPEPCESAGKEMGGADRNAKIAEIAYLKAESRGFEPGHELEDWLLAEQEVMR